MLVCIFTVTLINIDIPGTVSISLTINASEGYGGSILFYNCKTGISKSILICAARRYYSASFIAAVLVLPYLPLCQFCCKGV